MKRLMRKFSLARRTRKPSMGWHHVRIIVQERNADDKPTASDQDILDGLMNRHGYKRYIQEKNGDWFNLLPGEYVKSVNIAANTDDIETDFDKLARTIGWPCMIFTTITSSWTQICLRRVEPSTVAILRREGWI